MNAPNSHSQTVTIDPVRVEAMHAALARSGPPPCAGDPLPHFWHWSHFWEIAAKDALGRDGHPKRGGLIPDLGLPRRMWAGGALTFKAPLKIGAPATRATKVVDVVQKTGRTGPLAFVTLEHGISQDGRLCITERQDLVYREDPDPSAAAPTPKAAPKDEQTRVPHTTTPTDLFRYSALTFNGHRIHYDADYARDVEGYPGLITHGPLLAQRLIELAEGELGGLAAFSFRAVSPIFQFETFETCARIDTDKLSLWVRGPDGRLAMTAEAHA